MARPRADLGRAGALEPTRSPFQARACPCEWAKWSTGLGPGSDPGQNLLEQVAPKSSRGTHVAQGSLWGRTRASLWSPPADQSAIDLSHSGPHCAPLPPAGSQEQPFAPTAPLQARDTLAEQRDQGKEGPLLGNTHPLAPFPPPELPKPPTLGASLCHPGVESRARWCLGTHTA